MKLNELVRQKREEKGYTQEYMADKLGITKSAYNKIESGVNDSLLNYITPICEMLRIAPETIIDYVYENGYDYKMKVYGDSKRLKKWCNDLMYHYKELITHYRLNPKEENAAEIISYAEKEYEKIENSLNTFHNENFVVVPVSFTEKGMISKYLSDKKLLCFKKDVPKMISYTLNRFSYEKQKYPHIFKTELCKDYEYLYRNVGNSHKLFMNLFSKYPEYVCEADIDELENLIHYDSLSKSYFSNHPVDKEILDKINIEEADECLWNNMLRSFIYNENDYCFEDLTGEKMIEMLDESFIILLQDEMFWYGGGVLDCDDTELIECAKRYVSFLFNSFLETVKTLQKGAVRAYEEYRRRKIEENAESDNEKIQKEYESVTDENGWVLVKELIDSDRERLLNAIKYGKIIADPEKEECKLEISKPDLMDNL